MSPPTKKTNAELSVYVNSLATQWADFLKVAPSKADFDKLATKEDIQSVVQTELATFKQEMLLEMKTEVESKFTTFTEDQARITSATNNRVGALERKFEDKLVEIDAKSLLQDMYNRRLNFLLIAELEKTGVWKETPSDCLDIVKKYLARMIPDSDSIHIIDCHRLGKKSNKKNAQGRPICRPIIFRVQDMFEVRTIRENLVNLKKFFDENPDEHRVYFRRHLPQKMHLQRQLLQPKFSELLLAGDEPKWELDNSTAKFYITDKHGNRIKE